MCSMTSNTCWGMGMLTCGSSGEIVRTLRCFRQLSRARKLMLMESALLLPIAWVLVRVSPFRFWSRWLGIPLAGEANPGPPTDSDLLVRDVCWSVMAIKRGTKGRYTCLMLAMTAQWMLSRRHISSSLVLGTRIQQASDNRLTMTAHAWLRAGSEVVLGQHDGEYTAVLSFVRTYPLIAGGDVS